MHNQNQDKEDAKVKVYFGQFYVQAGRNFPFSQMFQRFISEKVTALVTPSVKYIKGHGEDYSLMFRISAKWQLAITEIIGPKVYKKDKDVEYSIFLPYTPIMQTSDPNRNALVHLFEAVYEVLSGYEINLSRLKDEQNRIIDEIMSSPEMFREEE